MKPLRGVSISVLLLLLVAVMLVQGGCATSSPVAAVDATPLASSALAYPIVDTGQTICYADAVAVACPSAGSPFYGQDAQVTSNAPSYTANGDGTVTDNVTGLIWQQSPDRNGDGDINASDKLTYAAAETYCENLTLAGATDWRLPDIKTLYSLIDFSGLDPSGYNGSDTSGLTPFINTDYFAFGYGDTDAGERIIDAQYASSTLYTANNTMLFGVNFADGRIKGYGLTMPGPGNVEKTFYVQCVRGNPGYGINAFAANGDGTITDGATGLMWAQNDSGAGLTWEEALAWVQTQNAANYLGYDDWRLPNVKELQSLVDYTRAPDATGSAALNPLFSAAAVANEAGQPDYPYYWSSTTHANWTQTPGAAGAYVAFGRALGYMNNAWVDVHGAGAQRSDPKQGDPADYPTGRGPQGDAIHIINYVRLVRDADAAPDPLNYKSYVPLVLVGESLTSTPAFTIGQTLSDGAQRNTSAFDALAFLTGLLGADSFFPPGKVADFWGFKYLRDNDSTAAAQRYRDAIYFHLYNLEMRPNLVCVAGQNRSIAI